MCNYRKRMEGKLDFLIKNQHKTMEVVDSIKTEVAGLKADIAALKGSEDKSQAAIAAAIKALEDKLAASENPSATDLQGILDSLKSARVDVAAVKDEVDTTPLPVPDAPPVPSVDPATV